MSKQAETQKNEKINAAPVKAFFVGMITRDIELQDAILDLLDNCIDGIHRIGDRGGNLPYKGRYAHITFDENKFVIEDNCGGIPLDSAINYAFRFGRPTDAEIPKNGSIGIYGIGMKRAIFKMGSHCVVHSYTKKVIFNVEINDEWLSDDENWELDAIIRNKSDLAECGTKITVTDLFTEIKRNFKKGNHFETSFPKAIQEAYSFLINKGFEIKVNNKPVLADLPSLLWTSPNDEKITVPKIKPYIYKAKVNDVEIFMAVGFWRPLVSSMEDNEANDLRYSSEKAGWTIICNDRVVLSRDQSHITGWGTGGVPNYHTQFIAIAGYVEFNSKKNPLALPMTTTKHGVNTSSRIYSLAFEHMRYGIKYFTSFTHTWKGYEDEQKEMFKKAKSLTLPELQDLTEKIKLIKIKGADNQNYLAPNLPIRKKVATTKRIAYTRPISEIKEVSSFLFDTEEAPPTLIGTQCFERTLKEARGK